MSSGLIFVSLTSKNLPQGETEENYVGQSTAQYVSSVHACVLCVVSQNSHPCVGMWRPEVKGRCLPLWTSTLPFPRPSCHWSWSSPAGWTSWWSPNVCLSSCMASPSFYVGVEDGNSGPVLVQKHYLLSHLSSPKCASLWVSCTPVDIYLGLWLPFV